MRIRVPLLIEINPLSEILLPYSSQGFSSAQEGRPRTHLPAQRPFDELIMRRGLDGNKDDTEQTPT
jgi:hypothetical protein